jgi:hypothetical protein
VLLLGLAGPLHQSCSAAVGDIMTVAGGGAGDGAAATIASLRGPASVAVDREGVVYVADTGNHRIRIVKAEGIVETVAGSGAAGFEGDNGRAKGSTVSSPVGLFLTRHDVLYIVDSGNHRVRVIEADTIRTVAGNGTGGFSGDEGPATASSLNGPTAAFVDDDGHLYIADTQNNRVRKVDGLSGRITTVAGTVRAPTGVTGGLRRTQVSMNPPGLPVIPSGTSTLPIDKIIASEL